jgi:hypothetical protein
VSRQHFLAGFPFDCAIVAPAKKSQNSPDFADPVNDKRIPDLTAQSCLIYPPQRDAAGVGFVLLAAIYLFDKLAHTPA